MTTIQWKRDHGSRSSRAGIFVSMVLTVRRYPAAPPGELSARSRASRFDARAVAREVAGEDLEPVAAVHAAIADGQAPGARREGLPRAS